MVHPNTDSAIPPHGDAENSAPVPPHTAAPNLDDCVEGARVWMTPGSLYQFTGIRTNPDGPPDLYAGLFAAPETAGAYIYDAGLAGVDAYLTINSPRAGAGAGLPVNDVTFAGRGQCVGDDDFDIIEKILLDLDTVRPSKTAATDDERAARILRAFEIRAYLAGLGFPAPITQATPNGAALLYRVNLPASAAVTIRRLLGSLAARFDDHRVKVDQVVYNPARLGRPAGSIGHKGVASAERPHRACELLCPGDAAVTPRNLIERVAAEAPAAARSGASGANQYKPAGPARGGGRFVTRQALDLFLAERLPELDGPHDYRGRRIWRFDVCPFNAAHDKPGDAAVIQQANGWVQFKCFHDGCKGRGFRDLIVAVAPPLPAGVPICIAAAKARRAQRGGPRTRR